MDSARRILVKTDDLLHPLALSWTLLRNQVPGCSMGFDVRMSKAPKALPSFKAFKAFKALKALSQL